MPGSQLAGPGAAGPAVLIDVGGVLLTDESAAFTTWSDRLGIAPPSLLTARVSPSIWPFWRRVASSTVEFSGSRLHNAAPHPEQI